MSCVVKSSSILLTLFLSVFVLLFIWWLSFRVLIFPRCVLILENCTSSAHFIGCNPPLVTVESGHNMILEAVHLIFPPRSGSSSSAFGMVISCGGHCPAFWLSTHTLGSGGWVRTSVLNAAGSQQP